VKKLGLIFNFVIFSIIAWGQVPGSALQFNGSSVYADMGEVFENVQTMEFWIKPNKNIDKNSPTQPILVRDLDGINFIGVEEFALFFEDSKNTEAGKLAFRVGDGSNTVTIFSDSAFWQKGIWYHIAVIISPVNGLKMYVNGVEQQDKNTSIKNVFFRQEGSSGNFLLGRWDSNSPFYLEAQIDELRFWSSPRVTTDIRRYMCTDIVQATNLLYNIKFNNKALSQLLVLGQNLSTILKGTLLTDYKKSNAPVGQSSVYLYKQDFTGNSLGMFKHYNILVDSISTSAQGLHIYQITEATPAYGIYNRGQFGVWFTHTNANYNVTFNYSSLSSTCDSCSMLKSRDHRIKGGWTERSGKQPGCVFKLFNESVNGLKHREEYRVLETIVINTGLPDSIAFCSLNTKFLEPNSFPGAVYIWNDSIKTKDLIADKPGLYTLDLYWHGCHVRKSVWVDIEPTPEFYLPKDTTICEGDTLWLTAPIDSAEYLWIGFFNTRKFGIIAPGTYNLQITKNGCSHKDEIVVDMIYDFNIDLGKDTTLCWGQSLFFAFSGKGTDYLWNDGSTQPNREIFNAPGTYWLKAYNGCFEKFDTVEVNYYECECHIFLANAFSPNADDINDIFYPVTECYYEEFEFEILNRWGEIFFKTTDPNQGWDGTHKGKEVPKGQYNWRMRYKKYSWMRESNYEYGEFILVR